MWFKFRRLYRTIKWWITVPNWLGFLAYYEPRYYWTHTKIVLGVFVIFFGWLFIYDFVWCYRLGFFLPDWSLLLSYIASVSFNWLGFMLRDCDEWYWWFEFQFPRSVFKKTISYYIRIQRYIWIIRIEDIKSFFHIFLNEWIFLQSRSAEQFAWVCFWFNFPLKALLQKYIWGSVFLYNTYAGNFYPSSLRVIPAEYQNWLILNHQNIRVWILDDIWSVLFSQPLSEPLFMYGKHTINTNQSLYVYFIKIWNKYLSSSTHSYEIIYHKSVSQLITTKWEKLSALFGVTALYINISFFFSIFILFLADYLANQRIMILIYYVVLITWVSVIWL